MCFGCEWLEMSEEERAEFDAPADQIPDNPAALALTAAIIRRADEREVRRAA